MLNKFQEVEALFSRADEHLKWLTDSVTHPDPNLFAHRHGLHVLEESGDIFASKVRIVIGEFASCLRNALNYLTCALAEQESGRVAKNVQFPLEGSKEGFARNRRKFLDGIPDKHLAFFERFQPYNAGKPFELLRELSNAYRHRELIRVEKQFHRAEQVASPPHTYRTGSFVVSEEPVSIAIAMEDGRPVVEVLEEIKGRVRDVVTAFRVPLARYVSEHSDTMPE